jgi:hypothetical protein
LVCTLKQDLSKKIYLLKAKKTPQSTRRFLKSKINLLLGNINFVACRSPNSGVRKIINLVSLIIILVAFIALKTSGNI